MRTRRGVDRPRAHAHRAASAEASRASAHCASRPASKPEDRAYVGWIRRFILFNATAEMGAPEVERFLSSLAVEGNVSASTQNQAMVAILFLYRDVLGVSLPWMDGIVRAKPSQRLPVVLGRQEVAALLAAMGGRERLMATLLYGSGLRLNEPEPFTALIWVSISPGKSRPARAQCVSAERRWAPAAQPQASWSAIARIW